MTKLTNVKRIKTELKYFCANKRTVHKNKQQYIMTLAKRTIFSEYKKTLNLSLPVIIAQAGQITVGLIDNIMIGKLGTTSFAAASFTNTLFSLVLIFGMGYSSALTPLAGKNWGSKNIISVSSIFRNGILANSLIGLLLFILLIIINFLIPNMGQPSSVIDLSQDYLRILSFSIFPTMIFYTYKQISEGIGDTKTAMRIMLWANLINCIVNYIFMFGKFGLPEMGLEGAAIGTLTARLYMPIAFIIKFNKRKENQAIINLLFRVKYSFNQIKSISILGLSLGGQMVMEASAFGICAIMMGWISENGIAAHQIAISLSTLGFMIFQGLGSGTTIRVSHYRGQNKLNNIKIATNTGIKLMLIYASISILLFVFGRTIFPLAFTKDDNVIKLAANMILVCGIFQIFDGFQIIFAGSLRGLADAKIPMLISFIAYFMISIPISYYSAFKWGYSEIGIWFGFPVGLLISSILSYSRYKYLLINYNRQFNLARV
ncbi:MAG: MATE family efflux transporter [Marinifilaceae bacterium]|nr:MATE family efflux transporter [Marinifilaceae bacterium]